MCAQYINPNRTERRKVIRKARGKGETAPSTELNPLRLACHIRFAPEVIYISSHVTTGKPKHRLSESCDDTESEIPKREKTMCSKQTTH